MRILVAVAAGLLCCAQARAAADFIVQAGVATDEKAVFATVESTETVPARVRTGGTIAALAVRRCRAYCGRSCWT